MYNLLPEIYEPEGEFGQGESNIKRHIVKKLMSCLILMIVEKRNGKINV